MTLSAEQIAAQLAQQYGVDPEIARVRAEAAVGRLVGPPVRHASARLPEPSTPVARVGIDWPVRLLLPWSYLVSDNEKHAARLITSGAGEKRAIRVIVAEYKRAEEKIALLAKNKVGDAAPVGFPLALTARVWVPNHGVHDITNFCKLVHDALEGTVYENDRWLHDVHWIRAGVDVDAPRAEIVIAPILRD